MMELTLDMRLMAQDLKCPLDFGSMHYHREHQAGPLHSAAFFHCNECGAFVTRDRVLDLLGFDDLDFAGGSSLIAEGRRADS